MNPLADFIGPAGQWGLWDRNDRCWLSKEDATGPNVYVDRLVNGHHVSGQLLARAAATIVNTQFFGNMGCYRIAHKLFPGGPFRIKDTVQAKHTAKQAMELMAI